MALFPVSPNRSAAILENLNGDISAADRPIYAVFGSRIGFSGSANRMLLIPVIPANSAAEISPFEFSKMAAKMAAEPPTWIWRNQK